MLRPLSPSLAGRLSLRCLQSGCESRKEQRFLCTSNRNKWEGKEWIVLDEDAPSVGLFVRYYVDPKTYFIWRTIQMTQDEKPSKRKVIQDFVVKSLELDVEIDESIFKP